MTSKKAEKKSEKKQGADHGDESRVAQKERKGNRLTSPKVARKTPEPTRPETPATPMEATPEVVVFAFRLTRSERDEIHAATESAKASRFVKAIVLAGARGDMKAIEEIVDGLHATSK